MKQHLFMDDKVVGPFESNWTLGLIAIDHDALYLIDLDFESSFKHSVNLQIPFIFINHFDKLKALPISELISKYKNIRIPNEGIFEIKVLRSQWKNSIEILFQDKTIKWKILERHNTDAYEALFEKLVTATANNKKIDTDI